MYFLQSAEYGKKIIIKNQIMWRSRASLGEADIIAGVVNIVSVIVIIFSQKNKKSLPIPNPWDGKLRDTTQIAGAMHLPLKRPVKVSHPPRLLAEILPKWKTFAHTCSHQPQAL
jgi:hypothetical protein